MAEYTLPDLPYDYAALEPRVSGTIMELHHDKRHSTSVIGADAAIASPAGARRPRQSSTT
ncbi:iron/manganese superoxide dismutase-like protein [Glaciihabitans tibetensis]|uniref:superoxide dismutase n=1 Tax=Glaciihabitans tibetensis TaxID=1266600 RepID=A0A2T0VJN9_9MICO|nr:iron/manganese superoxide dismutase-like protein [Glaciihabitans tibetensis]